MVTYINCNTGAFYPIDFTTDTLSDTGGNTDCCSVESWEPIVHEPEIDLEYLPVELLPPPDFDFPRYKEVKRTIKLVAVHIGGAFNGIRIARLPQAFP